ncbi:MAG: hypothetical protein QI223_04510 [Candidatus Korarchaeota archaeon]|nr:hypothetical protein [Candidatus Korarchaeota archaeon]
MRGLIRLVETGERIPRDELEGAISKAVRLFSEYLYSDYVPERPAWTMHSMLGPIGKLLSVLETGRAYTEEELVGFTARVHEQTSKKGLTTQALDKIRSGIRELLSIKDRVPKREWPRVISSVRYGVYQRALEAALQRAEAKRAEGEGEEEGGGE